MVDLQSTENFLSGSILILGMTQDIYFLAELEFAVNLRKFWITLYRSPWVKVGTHHDVKFTESFFVAHEVLIPRINGFNCSPIVYPKHIVCIMHH